MPSTRRHLQAADLLNFLAVDFARQGLLIMAGGSSALKFEPDAAEQLARLNEANPMHHDDFDVLASVAGKNPGRPAFLRYDRTCQNIRTTASTAWSRSKFIEVMNMG